MTRKGRVNITPAERAARIVLGLLGAVGGILLLTAAQSAVALVLEAFLILVGLDLVVTGVTGHCPLYLKLGHVPASLKGTTS